ncbi:DNA-packaging protein [Clostridium sp. Cult2]|uniref:DNA-packaging protein n=1 Tax=Clostridium sp. Cult2 TaxID=2079003 RepID=UPI001F469001|nr:DNA-packaging protein [Clostridium sp. Cult2]
MLADELVGIVKSNLNIVDDTKDLTIKDVIQDALNYCNLKELPIELEPYVRKKVKSIIDYEAENGTTSVFDIKSIKEGDTSITYNVDDKTSKETIYGLSDRDKKTLQQFRRTRK